MTIFKNLFGLAVAGIVFAACTQTTVTQTSVPSTPPTGASASPAGKPAGQTAASYTAADVAKHSTASDCWTIISGNVYDITSYIPRHPGGQVIVSICGQDGTNAFQSVGHSQRASDILASFQIGTLKQ